MQYDLARMVAQARKTRRREIVFREVVLPKTLASDLYSAAYAGVIRAWTEAVPSIVAEYERTLSGMTQDAAADISSVTVQVEAAITNLLVTVRVRLERWARRVEEVQRQKWTAAVKQGTGLDINMLIGPSDARETLGTMIERNVALVKSVSDQARDRIGQEVFQGLSERKPARDVAAAIREDIAMSRRRALNIASDQLSKASESLNEERRREAGLMAWEWVSSHKLQLS